MQNYSSDDLLRALKEHLVQHFDVGGAVGATPTNGPSVTQNTTSNPGSTGLGVAGGALAGAGAGAAAGSVVPGAGTALGAAAGAIGGATIGAAPALAGMLTTQNQYQAQLAPTQQTNYQPAIAGGANNALQGYGQFNQNLAGEQNLANSLQNQAAGIGPNPAQDQFAQNTQNNVAQQAALMAGQRGAGANAGLIAREAGQQGGAIQQNATGQAATLQAQQQIAAQQALQGQQGQIQSGIVNEQNANSGLLNTAAGAQNAQNTGNIQNYNNAQSINAGVAQNNANAINKTVGSIFGAAGNAIALNKGGEVPNPKLAKVAKKDRMPMPSHIKGMADIYHPEKFARGGSVQSAVQAPSIYDQPDSTQGQGSDDGGGSDGLMDKIKGAFGSSSSSAGASQMGGTGYQSVAGVFDAGGPVPGKAKVKGNSLKNDTVPILASAGEIVLPRSVTMAENPGDAAKQFVMNLHSKNKAGGEEDDFKSALSRAIKTRKSK